MGASYEEAHHRLREARQEFASSMEPEPAADRETAPGDTVWIQSAFTDFALQGPGHFFWEGLRQSFKGTAGGQLSRLGWYVHYDHEGERRAGTPILSHAPENLEVIEPLGRVSPEEIRVALKTSDRALRLDLRARMGSGPVVGLEFVLRNIGAEPVRDLRLTVYANLESAHTHMTDYAVLDRDARALRVIDLPTRFHLAMSGLGRPARGHVGTWASQAQLQSAAGVAVNQWSSLKHTQRMLDRLAEAGLTPEQWLAFERDGHLLADLLLEYRPLTECQWARQSPEEIARWREAEALAGRLRALADRGTETSFTPEWIDLMIEAARRIQFRPVLHERVAPYVRPHTPSTRTRSAAEAADLLRRDWLYQAAEKPTPERIRDEIDRARELMERITSRHPGRVDFRAERSALKALEAETARLSGNDTALYLRVREVKRSIVLANPVLDFGSLVFIDRPYPQGSEWPHETRHRVGYMSVPGGRLLVLNGLGPEGEVRQLMPQAPLHFQLLDERGRALQTMPSFVNVMPGETRGCLGCHESHSRTPDHHLGTFARARAPHRITPPPWGDETISFPRFVQPVLDTHCGSCHQGEGQAREIVDFTDRPGFLIFSAPYMLLTGNPTWGQPYRLPENPPPGFGYADMLMIEGYDQRDPQAYRTPPPMTALSYRSRLIHLASSGDQYHAWAVRGWSALYDPLWTCESVLSEAVNPEPIFRLVERGLILS